jgi:predicted NBD/HSP70 family sugar kinase
MMFLGIEIGGTKLQMGVGADDGVLCGLWRGLVDVAAGPAGIRRQIAAAGSPEAVTVRHLADAARAGDPQARLVLDRACTVLAQAITQVIALLCPRRIVIGGGVSLIGDDLLFDPLRRLVADRVFKPFAGLTDIVPAALGEEVVVHGALALARKLVTARSAAPSPPQPPSRPSSAAP